MQYRIFCVLVACGALAGCGGGGGYGGGGGGPAAGTTLIWQQPTTLAGIAGNIFVAQKPPTNQFALIAWQPNPNTVDGSLVLNNFSAGSETGFFPTGTISMAQDGFQNLAGSTTAQMLGDTVGAYINSADITSSTQFKMMITPEVLLTPVYPFVTANAVFVELNLQVPTATDAMQSGSNAYANSDLRFIDQTTGFTISYTGALFFHSPSNPTTGEDHIGIDPVTGNTMVVCDLFPTSKYLTPDLSSTLRQGLTWTGFKFFNYSFTKAQFAQALADIKAAFPSSELSMNPNDYYLAEFHLNAELHYQTAPATLGWSMKGVKISVL